MVLHLDVRGGMRSLIVALPGDLFIVFFIDCCPHFACMSLFEPHRDKTNKIACAPSEDSDQPGHPPSLIRVFTVRSVSS